ncbi:MAG: NADH-quinone oxidoreductase subunit N [Sulfobacillus sp.]
MNLPLIVPPQVAFSLISPELALLVTSVVTLAVALFLAPEQGIRWLTWLAAAGILVAAGSDVILLLGSQLPATTFSGSLVMDPLAEVLDLVILAAALLAVLLAANRPEASPDYLALTLWSAIGMMVLVSAHDLIVLFLAVEVLSLPLYILCAFRPDRPTSLEAAVKYFLLGAFSSGFLLYGLALLFGVSGGTNLTQVAAALATVGSASLLGHGAIGTALIAEVGIGLVVVGLGFKLAAVPFHQWVPDVYEGAPTSVVTFMSVGTKVAAFGVLARLVDTVFVGSAVDWQGLLSALAVATILGGAVLAIPQQNFKRLLGYSGILNAGYLVAVLVVGSQAATAAGVYFLVTYALMNLGAFAVISAVSGGELEGVMIRRYRGLFYQQPWTAVAMAVFLLSLASIPPLAGFFGKLFILQALISGHQLVLALTVVAGTAITLIVYGRPLLAMFSPPDPDSPPLPKMPMAVATAIGCLAVAVVAVGLVPGAIVGLVHGVSQIGPLSGITGR